MMAYRKSLKMHSRLETTLLFLLTFQWSQIPLANARILQASEVSSSRFSSSPLSWLSRSSHVWLFGEIWNPRSNLQPFEPAESPLVLPEDYEAQDEIEELHSNSTAKGDLLTDDDNDSNLHDHNEEDHNGIYRDRSQARTHGSNCAHGRKEDAAARPTSHSPSTQPNLDDEFPQNHEHLAVQQHSADVLVSSAPYEKQKFEDDSDPYPSLEDYPSDPLVTTAPYKKQKRQSNPCAESYAQCSLAGAPGLCCPTTAACSADLAGNVGCCPHGAACTGTIGVGATRSGIAAATASTGDAGGGVVIGGGAGSGGASVTAAVVGGTQTAGGAQQTGSSGGGEVILGAGATSLRRDLLGMKRWWGLGWMWVLGVAVGLTGMVLW